MYEDTDWSAEPSFPFWVCCLLLKGSVWLPLQSTYLHLSVWMELCQLTAKDNTVLCSVQVLPVFHFAVSVH